MIGILYLVLLGLVALTVSDSILDAFKNLTDSLKTSIENVQSGVDATFSAFEATKLKEEPKRAQPIYDRAKKASAYARELENYVIQLKDELQKEGGGIDPTTGDLAKRGDLEISTRYMINQKRASKLKKRINDTRFKLISLLNPKQKNGINFSFKWGEPPSKGGIR